MIEKNVTDFFQGDKGKMNRTDDSKKLKYRKQIYIQNGSALDDGHSCLGYRRRIICTDEVRVKAE